MGYEGANGSTGAPGWTDQSPAAHGLANTTATIDTSQFKFGTAAGKWISSGATNQSAYFTSGPNDWNFGSGRFTLETWIRFNTLAGTNGSSLILSVTGPGPTYSWYWWIDSSGNISWNVSTNGTTINTDINYLWSPALSTWYFIALDYDGTKYRMYVNGVMVGSSTTARNIYYSAQSIGLGGNSISSGYWLNGWLDETRITKGVARYASDAGFAVPTAAFPRVACSTTGTTATWNPADKSAQITLSGGNLIATDTSTGDSGVRSTTSHSGGKWYIEWTSGSTFTGANTNVGICTIGAPLAGVGNTTANAFLLQQGGSGAVWFNGSQAGLPQIGQFFTNRIAGMAIDLVNMRGWFRVDGASGLNYWNGNASYDPATNTGGVDISALFPSNAAYPVFTSNGNGSICTINSTFTYAAPSGFNPW